MRLVAMLSLVLTGCLGDASGYGPVGGGGGKTDQIDGGSTAADASISTSDLAPSPPDLSPPVDLFPADIAGMTNCFGSALCDPTVHFCIRFFGGSQSAQGGLTGGPACYEPSDSCANQGQQMDCGCIQADATLGVNCQGSCVDNMNGTFDCYRMP